MKEEFLKELVDLCYKYGCTKYLQFENRFAQTDRECYAINALVLGNGEVLYASEILQKLRASDNSTK